MHADLNSSLHRYCPYILHGCCRLVPYFSGLFCPIILQGKYEFLTTAVRSVFDENSSNHFYIRLCAQIFIQLFFLSLKLFLQYIFIITFKNYLRRTLTYMRAKLPIMDILNSQTANDGRSKNSNYHYTTVVLLLNCFNYQNNPITEIIWPRV